MADIELQDIQRMTEREMLIALVLAAQGTNEHLARLNGTVAKHEVRLGSTEMWRYITTGGLGVVIVITPIITALVLKLL